jgi:hypothetical protein
VQLDGDHVARLHGRLTAGGGAEIEDALARARPDREPRELRAAALRPDAPFRECMLVHTPDPPGTGHVCRLAVDLAADSPHDRLGRLVLDAHQCECLVLAPVATPELVDPVRVRLLQRPLLQPVEEVA